jgi:hypothetical protein
MTKPPRELLEFLRRHDAPIKNLALGLRRLVLDEMAPCHEYIFSMRSAVMLLFGPTDRVIEDCVCMIGVLRQHVNLQFADGVELEDSYGVLRGTGKRMRHITLKTTSELERPEIRILLQQARAQAGMTPRRGTGREVITRVKPPAPRPS